MEQIVKDAITKVYPDWEVTVECRSSRFITIDATDSHGCQLTTRMPAPAWGEEVSVEQIARAIERLEQGHIDTEARRPMVEAHHKATAVRKAERQAAVEEMNRSTLAKPGRGSARSEARKALEEG